MASTMLFLAVASLAAVIIPGLGHDANGATRWLRIGPASLQPSEPAKLAVIIYISAYLVRHQYQVQKEFVGFIKPIFVLTIVAGLLLLEPDFGAAVVLFGAALGMLFMGGVPLSRFFAWGLVSVSALATLAIQESYRMERLVSFTNPWLDPFRSGFQLTQALIAFGRGEWFGVGIGNSVQKLFYLPEVHTDFIFAMLGEELGLAGSLCVIVLFTFVVWRIFYIGGQAEALGQLFAARLAYGVGLLLGIAAFISMGVNMGLLPTKGLTLPFMSYGSNSILVSTIAIALVLRVSREVFDANRSMELRFTDFNPGESHG